MISLCLPADSMEYFYRNAEHDEMLFIHQGEGYVQTNFGRLPFVPFDYVYLPGAPPIRFISPQKPVECW